MAKQDVLDAINATIVENGQKGITAQSLNNVLTMMAENSGEGGSGEGALRVMIPMDLNTAQESEFAFTPEFWEAVGPSLDMGMPGAFTILNPIVQEMFSHNAEVYQKLMEKGVNREGVICLLDVSAFYEGFMRVVLPLQGISEVNINALSLSIPSLASIVDGEPQAILKGLVGGYGINIEPIIGDYNKSIINNFTQVQLLSDGSVKMSIGSNTNCIFIPEEQDVVLSDRYKKANLSVKETGYSHIDRIVKVNDYGDESSSCPRVVYTDINNIYFFDKLEIKKAVIEEDGSPTITSLGTINTTTA